MTPLTPHWTAYLAAGLTPVIAIIAAWIAFRQSQIARNKLKLDLFERRMAIYESVRKALGVVVGHGKLSQEEQINYMVGTRPARWLFGPEVFRYLDVDLWGKLCDLEMHNSMMDGAPHGERVTHIKARTEVVQWLLKQHAELDRLCAPYLTLQH